MLAPQHHLPTYRISLDPCTAHHRHTHTAHYKPLWSVLLGAAYQKIELAEATKHYTRLSATQSSSINVSSAADRTPRLGKQNTGRQGPAVTNTLSSNTDRDVVGAQHSKFDPHTRYSRVNIKGGLSVSLNPSAKLYTELHYGLQEPEIQWTLGIVPRGKATGAWWWPLTFI